ncbi:baseplate J/gp47 family protein [Nitratifractor salsuginis]|uniref:Baseplate J family protein n=1 Tax=Nitratifractor salsuginis (strain DSM 16511 / JCM 12458 / E9I37-1) TaxID=749222 RepID=E6X1N4_NITSE|nr:baseplate J/gp47 family protein [Nitratifractor salsuginis]ADV47025.1 Baseplate J family protein [Nitratifractor salsuginis DSM 16511]
MSLPDLVPPLSYEEILEANVRRAKEMLPGYIPAQGDDVMLVLQAFSYRELLLRNLIDQNTRANFLSTAEGAYLDHLAETRYGLYRLQGSKPYTTATFSLSKPLDYDVVIPEGYQLTEDGGIYFAHTATEAVIKAGETETTVTVILDKEVASSPVKTEIPVSPLPYLSVKQNGDYDHGGDPETDEEFRERIRVSLSDKSTAGAKNTYISYTLGADERISDVTAYMPSPGVVRVIYYAPEMDSVMQSRVVEALNADDVRPLTDQVQVASATVVTVDVTAKLYTRRNVDRAKAVAAATESVTALFANPQIGRDVPISRIIRALMVDGVEDVEVTAPSGTLTIGTEEVAVLGNVGISAEESGDVY